MNLFRYTKNDEVILSVDVGLDKKVAGSFSHILQTFSISVIITLLAMLAGAYVIPAPIAGAFAIAFLGMFVWLLVQVVRGRNIGFTFLYTFSGVVGVVLYPAIARLGSEVGARGVMIVFTITAVIFTALAVYAKRSKRDFSFMGGYLIAATLGLLALAIVKHVVGAGFTLSLVYAIAGVLIFSAWIVHDVGRYRDGVKPEEVPMAALMLYLDVVNLFMFVLRLFAGNWSSKS
ncbi:Bax inhibitor-1 family protein [Paenibacillus sp. 1P03SA]|uniref:Bax inhibitor-1/YccA family protein n=1 Tax=Paenibacillus sp. 1P03SA TaxID=3132294 RepID=UPI0039A2DD77